VDEGEKGEFLWKAFLDARLALPADVGARVCRRRVRG
jgi:hypothetical protein